MQICDLKNQQKISLKSLSIHAEVINSICKVSMNISHLNDQQDLTEATFRIPICYGASIFFFQAEIDGKIICGECKEKSQAKQEYAEAILQGHDAYLMENNAGMQDVFEISLGNIPAGKLVAIRLKYVLQLRLDEAAARQQLEHYDLALPVLLRERYNDTQSGGSALLDSNTAACADTTREPFKFTLSVDKCREVEKITAKSMKSDKDGKADQNDGDDELMVVSEEIEGGGAMPRAQHSTEYTLLSGEFDGTRDLQLKIAYKLASPRQTNELIEPVVLLEAGGVAETASGMPANSFLDQSQAVMFSFMPRCARNILDDFDSAPKTEFVFVIDRSGSMSGSRIVCASECLLLFLKSLPSSSRVQIIGFGSEFNCAFERLQPYTEETMREALHYQAGLLADMGGTEIYSALNKAYEEDLAHGFQRCILLMTDGDVGDQSRVVKLAETRTAALNNRCQLFTIGIGNGFSTSLVEQLARAGGGSSEAARDVSNLTAKVMHILQCALSPRLEEISVRILDGHSTGERVVEQAVCVPERVPIVMLNQSVAVFVLLPPPAALPDPVANAPDVTHLKLEFTAKLCNNSTQNEREPMKIEVPIESAQLRRMADAGGDKPIHRMLAKCQIEEMQNYLMINVDTMKPEDKTAVEKRIVEMSSLANIISNLTAFVAVDKEKMIEIPRKQIRYAQVGLGFRSRAAMSPQKISAPRLKNVGIRQSSAAKSALISDSSICELENQAQMLSCVIDRTDSLTNCVSFPTKGIKKAPSLFSNPFKGIFSKSEKSSSKGIQKQSVEALKNSSTNEIAAKITHKNTSNKNPLIRLATLQNLKGFWSSSNDVLTGISESLKLTCDSPDQLLKECPSSQELQQQLNIKISHDIWISLLVLTYLEKYCESKRAEWIILAKKCESWIRNELKTLNEDAEIDIASNTELMSIRASAEAFLNKYNAAA